METVYTCTVDSSEVTCDFKTGKYYGTVCEHERDELDDCLTVALAEASTTFCEKHLATPCADATWDQGTCEEHVQQYVGSTCTDEARLMVACAASRGEFSCGADGAPEIGGCDEENAAWVACLTAQ